jgi:hypothetical protein
MPNVAAACPSDKVQRVFVGLGGLLLREWVAWFNHHRLLEPIGNVPPAEAEANYYRQFAESDMIV